MPTDDPQIVPAPYEAGEPAAPALTPWRPDAPPRIIPNLGHTLLFFTIAVVVMIVASVSAFAIVMGAHWLGHESSDQLMREPRLLIPSMAAGYFIAGGMVWLLFNYLWRQPFPTGLRWNFAVVRRRWPVLLAGGVGLSLAVQFLSNFLPIPKTLPIDDFFRTPGDVWMVALFGTLVAPVFEELAFRGFLLPSVASSWDWLSRPRESLPEGIFPPVLQEGMTVEPVPVLPAAPVVIVPAKDPAWSIVALIFSCSLTSGAFALVHADQLAHAWAPLAVLFGVSLVLCSVRLFTHSLAASTFIHATYNGTIFSILFVATGGFRHLDKIT